MKKFKIAFIFYSILSFTGMYGQTMETPVEAKLYIELLSEETDLSNPLSAFSVGSTVKYRISIDVVNVLNVSSIHVHLGTSLNDSDILSTSINIDGSNLANDQTIALGNNNVLISLGEGILAQEIFGKVFFVDELGDQSGELLFVH